MKKVSLLSVATLVAASMSLASCGQKGENIKTDVDSMSYAIGVNSGASFKQNLENIPGGEANVDAIIAGFAAALQGKETKISPDSAVGIIQRYFATVSAKEAKTNKEAADKFFTENKAKKGVVTLASGLQYEIITEGKGEIPTESSSVKCHYHGTLLDGTVFDSSVERGEPAVFGVSQVIKGWTEALQLMPVGSKWKLYIPADLAYGDMEAGKIKPGSPLVFEIELLGIEK